MATQGGFVVMAYLYSSGGGVVRYYDAVVLFCCVFYRDLSHRCYFIFTYTSVVAA